MKIPPEAHLYYITDLQLKRLKLVQSSVAREIENQGWISDTEEERIKRQAAQSQQGETFFEETVEPTEPTTEEIKAHDFDMEMGVENA